MKFNKKIKSDFYLLTKLSEKKKIFKVFGKYSENSCLLFLFVTSPQSFRRAHETNDDDLRCFDFYHRTINAVCISVYELQSTEGAWVSTVTEYSSHHSLLNRKAAKYHLNENDATAIEWSKRNGFLECTIQFALCAQHIYTHDIALDSSAHPRCNVHSQHT